MTGSIVTYMSKTFGLCHDSQSIMLLVGGCLCLSQPALSLVSTLCHFSERVGSQGYIHVDFNIQAFIMQHCYDVMSFVCSKHLHHV